jgi:cytochrome b561
MVRNTMTVWGWPAKLMHWIGALAIVLLIAHGWWMTHMSARPDRMANYAWHAALGYDFLALLLLRLLWRWTNPVPALPGDLPRWERIAAHAGHIGLYVLMLAAAVTGWALAGTFRNPMAADLFGLSVPQIVASQDRALHGLFEESHLILAYLLALLILVHIAASLRHYFGKHNDVLQRMWFGARLKPDGARRLEQSVRLKVPGLDQARAQASGNGT